MQTSELIARLEAATGPDRELDRAIAKVLGEMPIYELRGQIGGSWLDYTASIDAALTLVPPNCVWKVMTDYGGLNRASVSDIPRFTVTADGETPALALCIAALRARNEGEG